MGKNNSRKIYSYDELSAKKEAVERKLAQLVVSRDNPPHKRSLIAALKRTVLELESHMALQERNEKLRIKNTRLVGMITAVKKAVQ